MLSPFAHAGEPVEIGGLACLPIEGSVDVTHDRERLDYESAVVLEHGHARERMYGGVI